MRIKGENTDSCPHIQSPVPVFPSTYTLLFLSISRVIFLKGKSALDISTSMLLLPFPQLTALTYVHASPLPSTIPKPLQQSSSVTVAKDNKCFSVLISLDFLTLFSVSNNQSTVTWSSANCLCSWPKNKSNTWEDRTKTPSIGWNSNSLLASFLISKDLIRICAKSSLSLVEGTVGTRDVKGLKGKLREVWS